LELEEDGCTGAGIATGVRYTPAVGEGVLAIGVGSSEVLERLDESSKDMNGIER
jgi:hypothetical protein